ncbi:cystatin-D-like isoform X1 [Oreochromis aureus]|uniref:cystatin-D-like isoform X1 n=1 Tax=Oreochromis aureus TaxID=47969 RepID=UPI00195455BF|nr:cystatin-D-like isoform X1 [Oreochromis aureus]
MFAWFCVFVCASAAGQTMTGEPRSVPVNDTRVLTAARFAVAEFNKVNAGETFAYKTVAITSAKIQVVAGIKYILDMLLGQTVCSRSHAAADSEPCAFQSRRKASSRTGWCITQRGGVPVPLRRCRSPLGEITCSL